jgi:hypothetical protein
MSCPICNSGTEENTFHFFAACSILGELRQNYFGQFYLSFPEVIDILNGRDCETLYLYVKSALAYRYKINNGNF